MARFLERVQLIGGNGGEEFSFNDPHFANNGSVIEKIEIWAGTNCLNAIRVTLSDGNSLTKGRTHGPKESMTFTDGQTILELSLWGNGNGTRCGGVRIKRSDGEWMMHNMTKWGLKTEYPVNVGSGIPVGIMGNAGWEIDSLGFLFLKKVASCRTMNVKIDLSGEHSARKSAYEVTRTVPNCSTVTQTPTVKLSDTVSTTTNTSRGVGLEVSTNASISFGPPECNIGGGITVSNSITLSGRRSVTRTRTIGEDVPITVPAFSTIRATLKCTVATFDAPYSATVITTFTDRSEMRTRTNGTYKGVSYSDGTITYRQLETSC